MAPTNEGPFVVSEPCPVCRGLDRVDLVLLASGDVHEAEAHVAGTAEILHVLEGDLELEVDGESHAAATGESVIFSADADHSYGNNGTRPLHVLMIVITPPAAQTITPGNDPRSGGAR